METTAGTGRMSEHQVRELEEIGRQLAALQQRVAGLLGSVKPSGETGAPSAAPAVQPNPGTAPTAAAQPPAPAVQPAPVSPPTAAAAPAAPNSLLDAILLLLRDDGKAMTFDEVFAELKKRNVPLPADKPMLAIRKLLYASKSITVQRGGLKGGLFKYAP